MRAGREETFAHRRQKPFLLCLCHAPDHDRAVLEHEYLGLRRSLGELRRTLSAVGGGAVVRQELRRSQEISGGSYLGPFPGPLAGFWNSRLV